MRVVPGNSRTQYCACLFKKGAEVICKVSWADLLAKSMSVEDDFT